ncbi:MAG: nucleotidyl transferase AbiEii/AbiGii toxin family protein [Moraxellaceae bacterium]|nr:nucleotidyl transferase AbiEii/AbiGii toxin family protein [Moraxellaceae bacterium]
MQNYHIEHHQHIALALQNFNADYLLAHHIIFGGGTRIALELDEFRESIDIDFLCPNKAAYRAVREQITNNTLGQLVKQDFNYVREIRADRDAVRTLIKIKNTIIKLEFVSFDDYDFGFESNLAKFPVPFLNQATCFYTKLLANSDRKLTEPFKDIFDILAMYRTWGNIPKEAIIAAESHYGQKVVIPDLIKALQDILKKPAVYKRVAQKELRMKQEWVLSLVDDYAPKLLAKIMADTTVSAINN